MRFTLIWVILLFVLLGCDAGNRPNTHSSGRDPIARPTERIEPPLDNALQTLLTPDATGAFERQFEPRLSTPAVLEVDDNTADTQATTPEPTTESATPTPALYFGTAIPTRGSIPTSTPIGLSDPEFGS